MPRVDLVVSIPISRSPRVKQLEGMFDVPGAIESKKEWHADIPFDDRPWSVGAIIGPSGSGKSLIGRRLFGARKIDKCFRWSGSSVIDDFPARSSMDDISKVCNAVGFSTIPAWRRPYKVLSTGERFRVQLARHLLEDADPIVIDEFTSVVDRQVAKIGAHAVQKYIRRQKRQFVAISCHVDIVEWLQPDWVFEPSTARFAWRSVQSRPRCDITVSPVPRTVWPLFAPFQYLTAKLRPTAHCFAAFLNGQIAAFAGVSRAVTKSASPIMQCNRLVTLPDFQGLGLAFVLIDAVGAIYKAIGEQVRTYPAHPHLIHAFDRSPRWQLEKRPATFMGSPRTKERALRMIQQSTLSNRKRSTKQGSRPCAVFSYCGDAIERSEAVRVLLYFADTEGRYGRHRFIA